MKTTASNMRGNIAKFDMNQVDILCFNRFEENEMNELKMYHLYFYRYLNIYRRDHFHSQQSVIKDPIKDWKIKQSFHQEVDFHFIIFPTDMKLSSNPRDGSGRTWQRTRGIQTRARAFKTFRKTFLCQHISRFTATFRQDWDKLSMFVGGFIQTLYTGTILHPFHSQFCFQTTDMNAFLCVFICTIHHTLFNTPSFTTTWRTEDDLRQCLKKSRLRRKQCLGRRQVSSTAPPQSWSRPQQKRHINTSFSPPTTTAIGLSLVLWCVLGRDTQPGPQRVLVLTPWYSITWSQCRCPHWMGA